MPEEKIKVLEEKNSHLWFDGSPVSVYTQRLALDIDKAELFASFKLVNFQPDNLKNITFDVLCYDSLRNLIDTVYDVSYTGFDVIRNIEFGFGRRVPIPNQQTRSVEFVLKSVLSSSGQTWLNLDSKRFDTALEQESIFKVQGDLNKQFIEICTRGNIDGTLFSLQPVFNEKFWLCGCGCFNWANEEVCVSCGVGRRWLERNSNLEVLQKQSGFAEQQRNELSEQYAEFEKYEHRVQAQQEEFEKRSTDYQKQLKKQKLKKGSKSIVITVLILVLLAAIAFGVIFYILPLIKYKSAMNDYEMYRYDDAIEKFTSLGDFADSKDFRLKSIYGYAFSLLNSNDPEKAAELFESLGNYNDSAEKLLEAKYKSGEKKYRDGKYIEAADIFHSLGNYSNSPKAERQCFSMIYNEAQENLLKNTSESLEKAYNQLNYIGNYKKAPELIERCLYLLGNAYYNKYQYGAAIEKYLSVPDYDEVKKILENIHMLADILKTAEKDKYAVWQSDSLHCTECSKNDSVYYLKLGLNGDIVFYAECADKNKKSFEQKGKFRLQNQMIEMLDDDDEWKAVLKINSIQSGENALLSAAIVSPYDTSVTSLRLHTGSK